MKNTLVKLAILTVSLFSASAFANKLVITGEPLALEKGEKPILFLKPTIQRFLINMLRLKVSNAHVF